ncbi:putative Zn-dependent protease [Breoghania corrubedonensis]|uniref:Putative Zn-dependent protease n=1 Tax=Breoghania corrubedonensis TaxID=665038 RepID=A0A2T5V935_9HYPH|nr:M48 family metalloprotease [Breoghania corrubedonensis]PTW60272.1 putative Zn-dependent protease [Breoghania corrubedonensis]
MNTRPLAQKRKSFQNGSLVNAAAGRSVRRVRSRLFSRLSSIAIAGLLAFQTVAPMPAEAQQRGRRLPVVRDAEVEALLRDYAEPILRAAGLAGGSLQIILVNDRSYNAFVVDSHRMFMNVGVIIDAKTPNEVIGVIAHEVGHIAGNHLVRLRQAAANAQIMAVLGTLLGAGAIAAGAASGAGGIGQGGGAMVGLGAGLAQRSLLSYQRSEEATADRSAIKYLNATHQSPKGMLDTFKRLADQQLFAAQHADPYAQSHPMARDRVSMLETLAKQSPYYNKKDPPALQARHDLARAKLIAFAGSQGAVARTYGKGSSLPARYARAIFTMQSGNPRDAQRLIDGLVNTQPKNPYFWELKGQSLIESGHPAASVAPFEKAVAYAPKEGLMKIWLGYALVATGKDAYLNRAVGLLKTGLREEPNSPLAYSQLAIAEARRGNPALADVATAKSMMLSGQFQIARKFAARAQKRLKRGSPGWLQADDIISYKPPDFQRR